MCRIHGGASPNARRAAADRIAEQSLLREFEICRQRWARQRMAWLVRRALWAAEVLDENPVEVARQLVTSAVQIGLALTLAGYEWPSGLRPEDEPQLGRDRRFGRRIPRRVTS